VTVGTAGDGEVLDGGAGKSCLQRERAEIENLEMFVMFTTNKGQKLKRLKLDKNFLIGIYFSFWR